MEKNNPAEIDKVFFSNIHVSGVYIDLFTDIRYESSMQSESIVLA
jgi:hypothetical protein